MNSNWDIPVIIRDRGAVEKAMSGSIIAEEFLEKIIQ
jgi:hypothetical protein